MRYRGENYLHMISIAGTLVHPGWGSPESIPPMSLMPVWWVFEVDFGVRLELWGELLEQEEDNSGAAEGKRESGALGERFEEQGEKVVL
jgi:hypothetical protein